MATLNGWQRLWVVVTIAWVGLWLAFIVTISVSDGMEGRFVLNGMEGRFVLASLAFAVATPVLLYAAGLGVAWVRRGFRG